MKLLSVVGTRPQIIKAAPIQRAIERWNRVAGATGIHAVVVDTGQHYDANLSGVMFDDLGLAAPGHRLDVGRQTGAAQLARMLTGLDEVIAIETPDLVLVYGDTTSTLAGALAARGRRVPLAHVEAGLRSFNPAMQEETNRVVADHLSDFRFCPTPTAVDNLRREGITSGVHLVDDVMEEALRMFLPVARRRGQALGRLGLDAGGFVLATLHRAETVDVRATLAGVVDGLSRLGHPVVWPCHPRTRARLDAFGLRLDAPIRLVEPLGYLDMLQLEDAAAAIATDSGGVQREAGWLGVPCLVLRDETEWLEMLDLGHLLTGTKADGIVAAFARLPLERRTVPASPGISASARIVEVLAGARAISARA